MSENKKKLSKKKLAIIITAIVLTIVFVATFLIFWFVVDETYKVDLSTIMTEENLVWQDNFDQDVIDTDNWRIEPGTNADTGEPFDGTQFGERAVRKGGYWTLDQCIMGTADDGDQTIDVLKIRTSKNDKGEWQTAGIVSDRSLAQKYGYFECRARLPKFYGTWSAFWMMPFNPPVAPDGDGKRDAKIYGGEIDIMEAPAYGRKNNQIVQQALHIGDYNLGSHSSTFSVNWLTENVGDIYDSFHTYGLYWDANMYKFYVDGKCVWTTSYQRTGNVSGLEQYLFLSTEIGGTDGVVGQNPWHGILPNGKERVTDNPADVTYGDFEIDYVRCYKIDGTTFAVNNQLSN